MNNLVTWPGPPGMPASVDYSLTVEGQPVFVYRARVRSLLQPREDGDLVTKRELTPQERAAFAIFDIRGPVTVEVKPARPFKSARVIPVGDGITPEVAGGVVRFRLTEPKHVTLLLDNSTVLPLHLFVSRPEQNPPRPGDPNVKYFGPGIHEVGQMVLKSGETLYVAGGAVLRAKLPPDAESQISKWSGLPAWPGNLIHIGNAKNVRVAGRGILDQTLIPRHGWTMVTTAKSSDLQIEGVTLLDSASWNLNIRNSDRVTIDNVRIIGARLNSDGIDLVNSQDVTVRNCFVRSHDDGIIAKTVFTNRATERVTVEDCQVWDDWGYALGATYETRSPIRDIVFRRCDVLYALHWAMGVHVSDGATVSDIRFEDITVHSYPAADLAGGRYAALTKEPKLLRCFITQDKWGHDEQRGQIRNLTLDRITVDGPMPPIELLGFNAQHTVENITIRDLRPAGSRPGIRTNEFVRNVVISDAP